MPYLVKKQVPQNVTFHAVAEKSEVRKMKRKGEQGFSLIEILVVVTVIGIIASLAVPHLQKGIRATENGNMYATMRTIASVEVDYYSKNTRFGRLGEINPLLSNSIGSSSGNDLIRGKFLISMVPATPTDVELKNGYTITATRNIASEGVIYVYQVTQTGDVVQVLP